MSETNIYNKLMSYIDNIYGVCGLMGNIKAESGMKSNNMQNSYESKLHTTDDSYTKAVDDGTYKNFVTDRVGYGLCQWTSSGRKQNLLNFAKSKMKSISNEDMQIEFLIHELSTSYKNVLAVLKSAKSVKEASDIVVTKFEIPKSVLPESSAEVRNKTLATRQKYCEEFYAKFSKNTPIKESTSMKGDNIMEIRQILLTNNNCYKSGKIIKPKGIVVHSTGANNKKISRYVQPDDGIIGTNSYKNDWNRSSIKKCVHAFIGIDKNSVVRVYQTLPWNYRSWGCGKGPKGTYNDSYIQFEICEDGLSDAKYFNEVFDEAAELCAHLMKLYPAITIDNVVSHHEAHERGYASGHADCDHWLKKFGKDMNWFRSLVQSKLNSVSKPDNSVTTTPDPSTEFKPYIVRVTAITLNVRKGPGIFNPLTTKIKKGESYTIVEEKNGWGKLKSGAGWISLKYTEKVK